MVIQLFPDNKLLASRQHIASHLVPSTIGVYHQHHMCEAITHRLKMAVEVHDGHYAVYSKTLMTDLYMGSVGQTAPLQIKVLGVGNFFSGRC